MDEAYLNTVVQSADAALLDVNPTFSMEAGQPYYAVPSVRLSNLSPWFPNLALPSRLHLEMARLALSVEPERLATVRQSERASERERKGGRRRSRATDGSRNEIDRSTSHEGSDVESGGDENRAGRRSSKSKLF